MAGQQHGSFGIGEQGGCAFEAPGRSVRLDGVARKVYFQAKRGIARALADIFGNVDENRTGASRGSDMERLSGYPGNVIASADQVAVLDHRIGDAGDIGFLKSVLAEHIGYALAGDHHHGDRVHMRGEQPGDGVRGPRARCDKNDTRAPCGPRVAICHMRRALLVSSQDQLDGGIDQCVEDGDRRAPRKAENVFHPLGLEGFNELLSASRGSLGHGSPCELSSMRTQKHPEDSTLGKIVKY